MQGHSMQRTFSHCCGLFLTSHLTLLSVQHLRKMADLSLSLKIQNMRYIISFEGKSTNTYFLNSALKIFISYEPGPMLQVPGSLFYTTMTQTLKFRGLKMTP